MKKLKLFSVTVLMMIMFSGLVPVQAQIEVTPEQHDFGEVDVGESSSAIIFITNSWWGNLVIRSVVIKSGSSSDFILINPPVPGSPISPGMTINFGVEFTPSTEGLATAVIEIDWTNGEAGTGMVVLSGIGVAAQPPPTSQDILDFFDMSADNGTLMGVAPGNSGGPGNSGISRLKVFRNILVRASYLITEDDAEGACNKLNDADKRCDGALNPTDFVQGSALAELNAMIVGIISLSGCE